MRLAKGAGEPIVCAGYCVSCPRYPGAAPALNQPTVVVEKVVGEAGWFRTISKNGSSDFVGNRRCHLDFEFARKVQFAIGFDIARARCQERDSRSFFVRWRVLLERRQSPTPPLVGSKAFNTLSFYRADGYTFFNIYSSIESNLLLPCSKNETLS